MVTIRKQILILLLKDHNYDSVQNSRNREPYSERNCVLLPQHPRNPNCGTPDASESFPNTRNLNHEPLRKASSLRVHTLSRMISFLAHVCWYWMLSHSTSFWRYACRIQDPNRRYPKGSRILQLHKDTRQLFISIFRLFVVDCTTSLSRSSISFQQGSETAIFPFSPQRAVGTSIARQISSSTISLLTSTKMTSNSSSFRHGRGL